MNINAIINAWNEQADKYNQWADLGGDEMVEFTIKYLRELPKQDTNTHPLRRIQTLAAVHCPPDNTDWDEIVALLQYFDQHPHVNIIPFLKDLIADNQECSNWAIERIVDKPDGEREERGEPGKEIFDHVYVSQEQDGDDRFYGYVYYPLPNGQYLQTSFSL